MKKISLLIVSMLVAITASAYVGETFEVGHLTYKVISEPPSKPAKLAVTGLNATGKDAKNLKLNIPSTVPHGSYTYTITSIESEAFAEQKNIVSVVLNEGIQVIYDRAFYLCSNLSNVTINGSTLIGIEEEAFQGTAFESIHLPASTAYAYGLRGKTKLVSITVDEDNPYLCSVNGLLYNKEQTTLIACPGGRTEKLTEKDFSSTLTKIGFRAFKEVAVKEIYLPYGVKELDRWSFAGSYMVIKLPSTIEKIEYDCFFGCRVVDLYCNIANPISLGVNNFDAAFLYTLHVPAGAKEKYAAAYKWKDFGTIKEDAYDLQGIALFSSKNAQGQDIHYGNARFSIIDTPAWYDEVLDGFASLVGQADVGISGTLTVPNFITDPRSGKRYAVTDIMSDICYEGMSVDMELVVGRNVSRIAKDAFKGITKLKKLTFSNCAHMQEIGSKAFYDCRISGDVILPLGVYFVGDSAFYNNSIKRLLIPSSVSSFQEHAIAKNNYLEEIIVNNSKLVKNYNDKPYDFTNIPSSCKVYVPVGCVDMFKNSDWGKFNVMEGAFDFVTGSNITGNRYKMTVTSDKPVTVDGVTYDGTAKYVYHPDVLLGSGAYVATDVETNTFNGKKYLMTEFGDSVLCGASGITSVTTSRMKHLERIGNYAFNGSGIKEFTIPSSIKNIGLKAFVGCKNLSELFITQPTNNYSWAGHFYGDNASDFTCYVKWTSLPDLQKSVTNWTKYNGINPLDQLNGYVQLSTDNKAMAIAVNHPVDWAASGMTAYVVSKYDPATQTVTTGTAGKSSANKGVLVTDFTKDQIYKLKRPTGTIYNKTNLLVGAGDAAVNVYQQPGGFLFDGAKKYFWKPTGTYNLTRGYAYLKLDEAAAGSTSRVYVDLWPYTPTPDFKKGDVNGDGTVDITDVNILLNIVLGKDSASKYNGRADVDGNGEVDITDVNTALNIVLGK